MIKKDLGYRRIQKTGRGSYIISLPKSWVEDLQLRKGSEVTFQIQNDKTLVLIPRTVIEGNQETSQGKYLIYMGPEETPQTLSHKIISLYVNNADYIHIYFKTSEQVLKYKRVLKDVIKNKLLGSEIIEETAKEITIQILINHPDFPIEKAIRRMTILALLANKDAISSLKALDNELLENTIETYNDVNRLSLYAIRQLKYNLEQNSYKNLGFKTPKEFLGYRILVNDLKSIATNAVNIAKNISTLKNLVEEQVIVANELVDEEIYDQILTFNSYANEVFEESLRAMLKRDYEKADKILIKLDTSDSHEKELISLMFTKKLDPNISSILRLILDSPRKMLEYSKNISEITLNRTIEELETIQNISDQVV
jgi:phosphate uptake regulator